MLKLLELCFLGRTELRKQLDDVVVRQIDNNGSLIFDVASQVCAPYERGVAVEATCPEAGSRDPLDPMIHILLHLRDGKIWMLEIYKDDGSPLTRVPDPTRFHLFSRHEIAGE